VVAPIVGPMAAGMVDADRRGRTSGILLSGSIGGMLLSRTLGGPLAESMGWRAPYIASGLFALVLAACLFRSLPTTATSSRQRYPSLLAEPLRLLLNQPELRRSCFYQAAVFAGFSAVWTSVALLLTGPTYGLGISAVGALALVNAGTMLCTPFAGRQVDRRGADTVNLVCLLGVVASALILAVGALGGKPGLVALVLGTLLLDVAMQCGMVANQVRIYNLNSRTRGRLNTAYMTFGYLGGAAGSWLGTRAYAHTGWKGVSLLVLLLASCALTHHLAAHGRNLPTETNSHGKTPRARATRALPMPSMRE
jgi:predicted MFS family arabinose efflux permease